ncbi:P-loop containing nucleoside triphosphate hydrolase protein [Aspergillus sclerotiicarbonarius CBS 121057]|uniref:P-loop containing nucleoside triphosphate hydrolase protein n=1 Tax=Aspergillus sclerotiicarbonarius (strain CBS 121057 / IBT 28362) TaxID=1448318 RepID=A0A319EGS1_ASPSB|nr:P-loop containing nucleoside triphosphate hydrolase protein [Aspergillus sclerotiicarbonarius CBS 121057]
MKMDLKDYSNEEIYRLLVRILKKRKLHVDGGWEGENLEILARRICRRRSDNKFTNLLALRALRAGYGLSSLATLPVIKRREAPLDMRIENEASKQLQSMIGLNEVKEVINELALRANTNYHREIQGLPPIETSLNRVFLGPPGTGKTTVARLYGQLIADLGLISSGEVSLKNPSDFIGKYTGESEAKPRQILHDSQGRVLVIDDAHMLYQRSGDGSDCSDPYRLAVVDTLVANISSKPGEDRCIILIGYPDQMKELFNNSNPGLRRRFSLEEAFHFQDYSVEQLAEILDLNLSRDGMTVTDEARKVAIEVLTRPRDRPNFGNGGDVDNLLGQSKAAFNKTLKDVSDRQGRMIEPADFDPEYDRAFKRSKACESLFSTMIGIDHIITLFQDYRQMAAGMRLREIDPRPFIPFAYVFKGPPGTGKTTKARILGQIFYDLGFLSTSEVIDCTATDMIGEYVGHTGPKVIKLLERALGKVLFIDEAYRLAGTSTGRCSSFTEEAVGELVDCMTKPRYARKLVIVLAGYSDEMDKLIHMNPGLRSRFPTDIVFLSMDPAHCFEYLEAQLGKLQISVDRCDSKSIGGKYSTVLSMFSRLKRTRSWANTRDVETLARNIIFQVYKTQKSPGDSSIGLSISMDELITCLGDMLCQRGHGHEMNTPVDTDYE